MPDRQSQGKRRLESHPAERAARSRAPRQGSVDEKLSPNQNIGPSKLRGSSGHKSLLVIAVVVDGLTPVTCTLAAELDGYLNKQFTGRRIN